MACHMKGNEFTPHVLIMNMSVWNPKGDTVNDQSHEKQGFIKIQEILKNKFRQYCIIIKYGLLQCILDKLL